MNNVFIGDSNISSFYKISNTYYKYTDNKLDIFTNAEGKNHNYGYNFSGASMYGITRDGRLKVREHIKNIIETTEKETNYFFLFGFVDINFIIPYKKIQNKKFCEYSFLRSTCKDYISFIKDLNRSITIMEIPYITIKQPDKFNNIFFSWFVDEKYIQLGKEYMQLNPYNQRLNIKITKYFNNLLEKECAKHDILFVRYNFMVVDKYDNIKDKFIISDSDHHYKGKEILPIYQRLLSKINESI